MFDTDLRNNSLTYTRKISALCVGEQPWDRIRHRVDYLNQTYALGITEFDKDGVPKSSNETIKLIAQWVDHMHYGYMTGQIDGSLSH